MKSPKSFSPYILLFFIFLSINNLVTAQTIKGYIFIDENKNGLKDNSEQGIKNVSVSNQRDVVLTDQNGFFELETIERNFIFVTKPSGYQFNMDEFSNPEFFYYYKTQKINEDYKYEVSKPVKNVHKILYFPLHENKSEEKHSSLLIGDPQMADNERLSYYQNGVVPFMATKNTDFYVELGDIADDYLDILAKEKEITGKIGIPGYRVFGNHDINFKSSGNEYAQETFKSVYGPEYYSFDYGSFHYVVLNNIEYKGWNVEKDKKGSYFGGLTEEQLNWLKNDLSFVSQEKTVVLFSHAPFHPAFVKKESLDALYDILKHRNKIFAVSGHLHNVVAYDYDTQIDWKEKGNFEGLVAGAACGAWWSYPMDETNIPYSTCTDGTPKGFFQLFANEENYKYIFHPVNYPSDFQMRIYVTKDEIIVNWFVGKMTDTVKVYLDGNEIPIVLKNFKGKDPLIESTINQRKNKDNWTPGVSDTYHLWKTELPKVLKNGYHSIKVIATDSRGKTFSGFKVFSID